MGCAEIFFSKWVLANREGPVRSSCGDDFFFAQDFHCVGNF